MPQHHIQGWIGKGDEVWDFGLTIKSEQSERHPRSLGDVFNRTLLKELTEPPADSKHQPSEEDEGADVSLFIPDVRMRLYATDEVSTLEEAKERVLLNSFGGLDVYQRWTGYSEWSKIGFDLRNMTLGNHDLLQILASYVNKYVHILIETEGGDS